MVPKSYQKGVQIHITTYKKDSHQLENNMEAHRENTRQYANEFICSICLNSKSSNSTKSIPKLCSICRNVHLSTQNTYNEASKYATKKSERKSVEYSKKAKIDISEKNNKTVTNTETNISQELSLLKEVLSAFKCKKQELHKEKSNNTLVFKDVGTTIDNDINANAKPELVLSKVFICCIDGNKSDENYKFTVVDCYQPDYLKKEYIIDLKKHKSSSIPQMKMDELKHSWKEKTKAKDPIEEVNRMFATVNINSVSKRIDENNRPVIRNGPRVLPVVKTKTNKDVSLIQSCKCCQTSERCLSSGDSFVKPECCHQTNLNKNKSEKCVYMLCCPCQKKHGILVCQNCQNVMDKCCKCEKHFENGSCENFG